MKVLKLPSDMENAVRIQPIIELKNYLNKPDVISRIDLSIRFLKLIYLVYCEFINIIFKNKRKRFQFMERQKTESNINADKGTFRAI